MLRRESRFQSSAHSAKTIHYFKRITLGWIASDCLFLYVDLNSTATAAREDCRSYEYIRIHAFRACRDKKSHVFIHLSRCIYIYLPTTQHRKFSTDHSCITCLFFIQHARTSYGVVKLNRIAIYWIIWWDK